MRRGLWAMLACGLSFVLSACGGGGGGDSAASPALTMSPSTVTANYQTGTSATLSVRASVADPSSYGSTVYAYVVDTRSVLAGGVELVRIDDRTFSASIHTSATLPSGHYAGSFQIQLCKDTNCSVQYPGSPVSLPYDFTVTPAPLHASATTSTAATVHRGGTINTTVTVSVTGRDLVWTASADAAWLRVSGGNGNGAGSFTVNYDASALAEGSYTGKITVNSSDGQSSDVGFTLEVLPTQFSLISGVPTFQAVNGAPVAAQSVTFELDNKVPSPWSATSTVAWMTASPLSGTTPATVTLQPDPTIGPLASGSYASDLVLSSPGIASKTVTTNLALTPATLSAPATTITLGGTKGRDMSTVQELAVSLNTGTNAWPFSLSSPPSWLSVSRWSATVGASGTTVGFKPNAAAVTAGSFSAAVTMTAAVNADVVSFPIMVNLNADQRRLLSSAWGVGFASTPTGSVLQRTITITDNFNGNKIGPWTWTSDSMWLTGSSAGSTDGPTTVTLIALPGMVPDGVSYATVTISSLQANVEPAVVRVALYKSSTGLGSTVKLAQDYTELVADKIAPYVYAHAGGTSIDVYQAYTAQKVATLSNVGSALGKMSLSPDGSRLYALDTATRSLKVVDLSTHAVTSWPLVKAVSASTPLLAIRPNGVEVVFVGDGTAYTGGRSLGSTGIFGTMSASSDGRKVYTQDTGLSPASVAAYDVDYTAISGGLLMVNRMASASFVNGASNGKDIAVSEDASHLYTASGAPYRCSSLDASNLQFLGSLPGGDAYPNNVEVTSDGRGICGIFGWYASADFWVHSSSGALLGSYKVAGYAKALKDTEMVVTPDGFVVVALTDDPEIAFVPIGP